MWTVSFKLCKCWNITLVHQGHLIWCHTHCSQVPWLLPYIYDLSFVGYCFMIMKSCYYQCCRMAASAQPSHKHRSPVVHPRSFAHGEEARILEVQLRFNGFCLPFIYTIQNFFRAMFGVTIAATVGAISVFMILSPRKWIEPYQHSSQ